MKKIKGKIFRKIGISILILVMLSMSIAQGYVQQKNIVQPMGDPFFAWEDLFNTEENIDPYYSYDYELISGVVQMKNTYSIW